MNDVGEIIKYVCVLILFLIQGALQLLIAPTDTGEFRLSKRQIVWYELLSCSPVLAFWIPKFYLPVFYLLFLAGCLIQERVIHMQCSAMFRFAIFGSIHLSTIGLKTLASEYNLPEILGNPIQIIDGTLVALLLDSIFYLCTQGMEYPEISKAGMRQEALYFQYFLVVTVGYVFLQSVLCLFPIQLDNYFVLFLCENLISVLLLWVYVHTLVCLSKSSEIEDSNLQLHGYMESASQRVRALQGCVHYDKMTGARSRLFLIQETGRLLDSKIPFSLVYLDLNGLKCINDIQGHQAGDQYLVEFVQHMQQHMRQQDTFARFGGDEFILLMPGYEKDHAKDRMERLQECMLQFPFEAGVVDSEEAQTLDQLIAIADEQMYQEKRKGRVRDGA